MDNFDDMIYQKSPERLREEAYLNRCREYWRKEKENDKEIEALRAKLGIKKTLKNTPNKLFEIFFKIAYWCIVACVLAALIWLAKDGIPLLALGFLWVGALLLKCSK